MKNLEQTQKACCSHYKTDFSPVKSEQMVVISDGVYEGIVPIEGVRYPSPSHMSGWWLTTDEFDGDVNSLKTVHYSHVVERRPEVAIYMALPFGYRFQLGGEKDCVWFDEGVVSKTDLL